MLTKLKQGKLNFRSIAIITIIPLAFAALFIAVATLSGLPFLRFDAGYFTPAHREQYAVPNDILTPLEHAMHNGDRAAYRELSGLRVAPIFPQSENIRMATLLNHTDTRYTYLYWDTVTLDRYEIHVEFINGRWVVSPSDLAFYLRTGRWLNTWTPLAATWWILELTLLIVLGLNALMNRWKQDAFAL